MRIRDLAPSLTCCSTVEYDPSTLSGKHSKAGFDGRGTNESTESMVAGKLFLPLVGCSFGKGSLGRAGKLSQMVVVWQSLWSD